MDPKQLLAQARDVMTVRQVFGEAIERDGATVIPVAKVMGGGGGGEGGQGGGQAEPSGEGKAAGGPVGAGGGFGFRAVPAGVYVIKEGKVSWEPALDLNRVILGGQIVGVICILVVGALVRMYLRRRDA
ncbi:MAG TPA: hypothetical protein VH482_00935 [Thermomicrobiales bacterium]